MSVVSRPEIETPSATRWGSVAVISRPCFIRDDGCHVERHAAATRATLLFGNMFALVALWIEQRPAFDNYDVNEVRWSRPYSKNTSMHRDAHEQGKEKMGEDKVKQASLLPLSFAIATQAFLSEHSNQPQRQSHR
jgi:hypothetical protein